MDKNNENKIEYKAWDESLPKYDPYFKERIEFEIHMKLFPVMLIILSVVILSRDFFSSGVGFIGGALFVFFFNKITRDSDSCETTKNNDTDDIEALFVHESSDYE